MTKPRLKHIFVKRLKLKSKPVAKVNTVKYQPTPAWRYRRQSTGFTITIKGAISGTFDPWSIFTTAEGMTALHLQGKAVCVYILCLQSLGLVLPCPILYGMYAKLPDIP